MPTTHRTRGEAFAGYSQLTTMACPICGVLYAIPEALRAHAEHHGAFKYMWHCPNGHELGYGTNELERAQNQLKWSREHAARVAAERDQAQAHARAEKAAKTRFKNQRDRDRRRVAHGVCPCCRRTFKQLARHMASQHPEFVADADAEIKAAATE